MTRDLHRLVYYSRNRIPGSSDAAQEIESILAASRRNNVRDDVTGALLFNAGVFAQVLEGPRCNIEATFERIQRDPRHGDVMVLAFEPVAERRFPSWSMAFVGHANHGRDVFAHIGPATGYDDKRLQGERICSLLHDLVLEEESAVA